MSEKHDVFFYIGFSCLLAGIVMSLCSFALQIVQENEDDATVPIVRELKCAANQQIRRNSASQEVCMCILDYEGTCVSQCPYGTVANGDGICESDTPKLVPCAANKTRIDGQGLCVCKYSFGQECVDRCPPNWEPNPGTRICVESEPVGPQTVCRGENEIALANQCVCVTEYRGACVANCPEGYEATDGDRVCRKCPLTRLTEQQTKQCVDVCPITSKPDSEGVCHECTLIYGDECVTQCPNGFEAKSGSKVCEQCSLTYHGQCVQNCPAGTKHSGSVCRDVEIKPPITVTPTRPCGINMTRRGGICECIFKMGDLCVAECPAGWDANESRQCINNCPFTYNDQCVTNCPERTYIEGEKCKDDTLFLTPSSSNQSSAIILGMVIFAVLAVLVAGICAATKQPQIMLAEESARKVQEDANTDSEVLKVVVVPEESS